MVDWKTKNSGAKTINTILIENKVFLLPFLLFLLLGAISLFLYPTGHWIEWFSQNRTPFRNTFFSVATRLGEEKIYLLAILLFIFIKFRYAILIPLTGIIVTIVSFGSKAIFQHDRPSVFYKKLGKLEEVNPLEGIRLLSGQTSFPSGHTMSGFAIYSLLAFLLPKKFLIQFPLFICAMLVGLSRIYLVQHFLKDIYLGSICGVLIAILLYHFQSKIKLSDSHLLEKSILSMRSPKA